MSLEFVFNSGPDTLHPKGPWGLYSSIFKMCFEIKVMILKVFHRFFCDWVVSESHDVTSQIIFKSILFLIN